MANQFASISSAMAILKIWYAGPIVSQFNDEIPFYREVEKGKEKWNGLQVNRPVKVRRNPGIGATGDGGLLPKIGQQTTQQAVVSARFNYLRFGVTGPMLKASQGDKGAFVSAMEFEMTEGLNDLKNDVNRQIFWNGDGTLATVGANAIASTVITVTGREATEAALKFLDVGLAIDIVSGGVVVATNVQINATSGSPTASSATLTLSAPVTCSANDIIVHTGAYNQEIQGILYSMDGGTSTIYSIDRSAYQAYQGNVTNAAGGQLTLNLMQQAWNEARRRGGGKVNCNYCDFDSERFYNKLLVPDKRYIGKVQGDGTFSDKDKTYLEFAGVPLVADKDSPTRFFFLDTKTFKKYVLAELEWADESGAYLIPQVSVDGFEARLRLFANMFNEKPSANSILRNYISP